MALEDVAQELEAAEWAARNAERPPMKNFEPGDAGYGPAECDDCGEPMHVVRRRMGSRMCVPCINIRDARRARGVDVGDDDE